MTNQIVTVQVTQTVAPAPNTLQRTGALISQGGTSAAVGSRTLITELADLTATIIPAKPNTTLVWATGVVTVTTAAPHNIPAGVTTFPVTIAGALPAGFNGNYTATRTGVSTFTYPLVSTPGAMTQPGTYAFQSATELLAMATTFFAQGAATSAYVLELGLGSAAAGVAALNSYIIANPDFFYSYLIPRAWTADSTFVTMVMNYESMTAKTYFYVSTDTAGATTAMAAFNDVKSVILLVEAPNLPATEFTNAAPFHVALNYQPSTTNMVTPYAFSYLFGVTAYPTPGNGALFATWKAAGVNWVGTGAEGGISNRILLWGTTMDGRDFIYWYAVDWFQINIKLDLANEIINGSNNPLAPLYYDQNGINRLQARAQATANRGITYGLLLSPVVVNAVSFPVYVRDNPSDYPIGAYNGLSCSATPKRGFISILFNLNVTDFPTS